MGSGSDGRRLSTKTRRNGSGDNRVCYPLVGIGGCVANALAGRIQCLGFLGVAISRGRGDPLGHGDLTPNVNCVGSELFGRSA